MNDNKTNRLGEEILTGDNMVMLGDPRVKPGIPLNTHHRVHPKPDAKPVWVLAGLLVLGLIATAVFYPGPHF